MKRVAALQFASCAILLGCSLTLNACNEGVESNYASTGDAARDGAFERGWLPRILQRDATAIHESHDLDSGHVSVTFQYVPALNQRLSSECRQIGDERVTTPFDGFPEFLQQGDTGSQLLARGYVAYQCGDFTVVTVKSTHNGYAWQ